LVDLREVYHVDVTIDVRLTSQRGVIAFHGRATGLDGGPLEGAVIHTERHYPTPSAARLHAGLYTAAIGLAVACSHEYEDRTGKLDPRAGESTRKGG
jgi:hypothetical protein